MPDEALFVLADFVDETGTETSDLESLTRGKRRVCGGNSTEADRSLVKRYSAVPFITHIRQHSRPMFSFCYKQPLTLLCGWNTICCSEPLKLCVAVSSEKKQRNVFVRHSGTQLLSLFVHAGLFYHLSRVGT